MDRRSAKRALRPPSLSREVSRTAFSTYVAEALRTLSDTKELRPGELRHYTEELAQALRALSKPAPASTKTMICEAMAPVWDMRANTPTTEAVDLKALVNALEALRNCCATPDDTAT